MNEEKGWTMQRAFEYDKAHFSKEPYQQFTIVATIDAGSAEAAIIGIKSKKEQEIILKYHCPTSELPPIYEFLNMVLRQAKKEYDIEVAMGCIGASGPISRHRRHVHLTNADLEIRKMELLEKTALKNVILVNDFEAIGYGIDMLTLKKDAVIIPHAGEDLTEPWNPDNRLAAIGVGSGLGMTIAPYNQNKHLHWPLPSEGGHMEFAPNNAFELELVDYLKENVLTKQDIQPEYERLLSTKGLGYIYDFLGTKGHPIKGEITKLQGEAKAIAIEQGTDETCKKALDIFMLFYARAARNLALMSECYTGLFLVGKMANRLLKKIQQKEFMREFEKHDKRSDVLWKVPVYVITNQDVALYGCANVVYNFFNIR